MNKILTALLIAAALSGSGAFAEDKFPASAENGMQRMDFSLIGNEMCPLPDDNVTCDPKV